MITYPEIRVNGLNLANGASHIINWQETSGILEAVSLQQGATKASWDGPHKVYAEDNQYPPRRIVIVGRIINQAGFLSKYEAQEQLARAFAGRPAILQVGSLYLEATFGDVVPVEDDFKRLGGSLTYRVEGEAVPGLYFGEYSHALGREQGITVADDRPGHPARAFTVTGGSFRYVEPGTAPTAAMVRISNPSMPGGKVYLRGSGPRRVPVNLDSQGVGVIDELSAFTLQPGAQTIRLEDKAGALLAGTFAVSLFGTRSRFTGNAGNRYQEGPVSYLYRASGATVVNALGVVEALPPGAPRVGVPHGAYASAKAGLLMEGRFRNYLPNSDAPSSRSINLTPGTYTVYMDGPGSITLSGGASGTVTQAAPRTFILALNALVAFTISGTVTRFGCVDLPWRPSHVVTSSGSRTQEADLVGNGSPHNELMAPREFTDPAWKRSAGATLTPNNATASDGTQTASTLALAATGDYLYQATEPPEIAGVPRTVIAVLRAGTLAGSLLLCLEAGDGTPIASTTISTAGLSASESRPFTVTGTPGASVTGLRAVLKGNAGTGTVILESLHQVEGSFPHMVEAPFSNPHGGDWSSDWGIRFEEEFSYVWPFSSTPPTGRDFEIVGERLKTGGISRLAATPSSSHSVRLYVETDAGTFTLDSPGTATLFDGNPHKIKRAWRLYVHGGSVYLEGTLGVGGTTVKQTFTAPGLRIVKGPERLWRSRGTVWGIHRDVRLASGGLPVLPPEAVYHPATYGLSVFA